MMAVVLAAIVLMGVAVPIVSALAQLAQTPVEGENSGDPMSYGTSVPASHRVTASADGSSITATVGGEALSGSLFIVTDTAVITVNSAMFGVTWTAGTWESYAESDGESLTVDANTWTYVYDDGGTPATATGRISWAYWTDSEGDYVMAAPAGLFVDPSARIAAYCTIDGGEDIVLATASGTPLNMYPSAQPAGLSFEISFVDDESPLEVTSASFTLGSETEDAMVALIVPAGYVESYEDTSASSLIFLIPLILVVALVVGVAYRFMVERRE